MAIHVGGLVAGQIAAGTVDGTGAAITVGLGFKPKYVKVANLTTRLMLEHFAEMADGAAIKTVAAGTRTAEAADCITFTDRGFVIGTDATNGNGNVLGFLAIG